MPRRTRTGTYRRSVYRRGRLVRRYREVWKGGKLVSRTAVSISKPSRGGGGIAGAPTILGGGQKFTGDGTYTTSGKYGARYREVWKGGKLISQTPINVSARRQLKSQKHYESLGYSKSEAYYKVAAEEKKIEREKVVRQAKLREMGRVYGTAEQFIRGVGAPREDIPVAVGGVRVTKRDEGELVEERKGVLVRPMTRAEEVSTTLTTLDVLSGVRKPLKEKKEKYIMISPEGVRSTVFLTMAAAMAYVRKGHRFETVGGEKVTFKEVRPTYDISKEIGTFGLVTVRPIPEEEKTIYGRFHEKFIGKPSREIEKVLGKVGVRDVTLKYAPYRAPFPVSVEFGRREGYRELPEVPFYRTTPAKFFETTIDVGTWLYPPTYAIKAPIFGISLAEEAYRAGRRVPPEVKERGVAAIGLEYGRFIVKKPLDIAFAGWMGMDVVRGVVKVVKPTPKYELITKGELKIQKRIVKEPLEEKIPTVTKFEIIPAEKRVPSKLVAKTRIYKTVPEWKVLGLKIERGKRVFMGTRQTTFKVAEGKIERAPLTEVKIVDLKKATRGELRGYQLELGFGEYMPKKRFVLSKMEMVAFIKTFGLRPSRAAFIDMERGILRFKQLRGYTLSRTQLLGKAREGVRLKSDIYDIALGRGAEVRIYGITDTKVITPLGKKIVEVPRKRIVKKEVPKRVSPYQYAFKLKKEEKLLFKELPPKEWIKEFPEYKRRPYVTGVAINGKPKEIYLKTYKRKPKEYITPTEEILAHELIHFKQPTWFVKLEQALKIPYRKRPTEIMAYGLERRFFIKGFKVKVPTKVEMVRVVEKPRPTYKISKRRGIQVSRIDLFGEGYKYRMLEVVKGERLPKKLFPSQVIDIPKRETGYFVSRAIARQRWRRLKPYKEAKYISSKGIVKIEYIPEEGFIGIQPLLKRIVRKPLTKGLRETMKARKGEIEKMEAPFGGLLKVKPKIVEKPTKVKPKVTYGLGAIERMKKYTFITEPAAPVYFEPEYMFPKAPIRPFHIGEIKDITLMPAIDISAGIGYTREIIKPIELEKTKELELEKVKQKELQRVKQRERQREKQRELERQKELEKQKELQKELQRQRELERQKEKQRQRERERAKERVREKEFVKEKARLFIPPYIPFKGKKPKKKPYWQLISYQLLKYQPTIISTQRMERITKEPSPFKKWTGQELFRPPIKLKTKRRRRFGL